MTTLSRSSLLEKAFMTITVVSILLSLQMLINLPDQDIPDIKDVAALFPNLN